MALNEMCGFMESQLKDVYIKYDKSDNIIKMMGRYMAEIGPAITCYTMLCPPACLFTPPFSNQHVSDSEGGTRADHQQTPTFY